MSSPVEKADRIARKRALFAPFAGLALLTVQQWLFFGQEWQEVGGVQLATWLVLALLALLFLLTGGLWFVPRDVRALAEDDATERNRAIAIKTGFIAALIMTLLVFAISPFEPLSAQRAAHIISSIGLGIALIVFGIGESRSLA